MIESAVEFVRLRKSEIEAEYIRAAHENAPLEVWREVIEKYPEMKIWVIQNKTVPIVILEILHTDEDASVRSAVARKRKASPTILRQLAGDSASDVRYAVACNKKTPAKVLHRLLGDEWEAVRAKAKERMEEMD